MDVKAPLDARYALLAGCPIDLGAIRATMALLRDRCVGGVAYEFRTTVAPPLGEDDLRDIAAALTSRDPWYLQAYLETPQVDPTYAGQPHLTGEALQAIAYSLRADGWQVVVRSED